MAGRDVKFILPTDRDCTFVQAQENKVNFIIGGTEKNPARNIWWIGGKILAPPAWGETGFPQKDPGTMSWPNGLTLKFVKGTAYFEGLHADMRCTCRDVIAAANLGNYEGGATLKGNQPLEKTPKIIVVNSILENPLQCTVNPSIHGDIIHSQGSGTRPEVWLQNVVFRHGFQGLFLDNSTSQPAGHGATRISLDHVQIYKRTEVNCQRTEGKAGTTGSVMWNVAPRDKVWFNKVWAVKGATTNPGFTIVNNCATYPDSAGVGQSNWCQGTGPNGDPVTPDKVGRNYFREYFSNGSEPPPPPTAPVLTIEPIDSVVSRGTTGTTQRIRIKRTGDTSSSSTVTYGSIGSGTNPAQTTDFVSGNFPTGSVTFTGDDGSGDDSTDPGDGGGGTTPPPPPSGTYDLALEFDNHAAGTAYTHSLQVTDSGGRSVENYTGGIYTAPLTIVDNGEGGKALRVGVGPNCQQASHRPTGLTQGKEYIFETRLRFAPNFVSAQKDGGGKVFFGIQGGVNNTYNPSANDTSGSTLVMYAGKSRLRDYTYDQTRSCVGSPNCWGKIYHDFGSKATGWHTIKIRTKLNTPGQSNGILEYWYDGVKTLSKTNIPWIKAGIDWSWYKARFTTTIGGPCTVGGTNSFSEASYIDYDYFRYQRVN